MWYFIYAVHYFLQQLLYAKSNSKKLVSPVCQYLMKVHLHNFAESFSGYLEL